MTFKYRKVIQITVGEIWHETREKEKQCQKENYDANTVSDVSKEKKPCFPQMKTQKGEIGEIRERW